MQKWLENIKTPEIRNQYNYEQGHYNFIFFHKEVKYWRKGSLLKEHGGTRSDMIKNMRKKWKM
jgi:hypothetical protein